MAPMNSDVDVVRAFNRFYTRQIGVLEESLLGSPFSLAEARVMFELARHKRTTASEIGAVLGLDPGYLSRILSKLGRNGFVVARPSPVDSRSRLLDLTTAGRRAFAAVDGRSHAQVEAMLAELSPGERERLIAAMSAVQELLACRDASPSYDLRPHRPGDLGWIVHRHAVLYAALGWNPQFEGKVAEIVANFAKHFDPACDRCWVADQDGAPVGSVALARRTASEAQLRLLLVEPRARGLGLGRHLVTECIASARQSGYRTIMLETYDSLHAARTIYAKAGFKLAGSEPDESYAPGLCAEIWRLKLV